MLPKGEAFHFGDDETLDLEKKCELFHRRFAAASSRERIVNPTNLVIERAFHVTNKVSVL